MVKRKYDPDRTNTSYLVDNRLANDQEYVLDSESDEEKDFLEGMNSISSSNSLDSFEEIISESVSSEEEI